MADGKERVMTEVYCTFDDCIFYKPHDEDYGICTKDHITLDEEVSGRTCGCPDAEWGEPQTDCGDFADRLAYERGVKHAWEVAQKVFDSTVTFYEAEDVAKQIAKTEPQTCNDCDQQRCETCVTEIGIAHSRADGKERVMTREDAIYEIKQLAVLSTNKNIERITEALNMAVEALQIVPIKMVYCKDCDNYAGEGMYCAWNVLTADMGYCHHARPKGGTDVTTDCPWG